MQRSRTLHPQHTENSTQTVTSLLKRPSSSSSSFSSSSPSSLSSSSSMLSSENLSYTDSIEVVLEKVLWGRTHQAGWTLSVLSGFMMVFCPIVVLIFWASCNHYKCSLWNMYQDVMIQGNTGILELLPQPTISGFIFYLIWWSAQVSLAYFVPGFIAKGQVTPAGNLLKYNINGFRVWLITHVTFVVLTMIFGFISPTVIYDNWEAILVCAIIYGYSLTFFSYIKGLYFPTHENDRKLSGSRLYDLFMGVELNPRIGNFDLKLFHNGRIGIVLWTLVNMSFAAKQYQMLGYITNSMLVLNALHMLYVLDFFWHESWYLRTIDIAHDHFGFYLCFGDSVWLPFLYPIQSFFLVQNPVDLSLFMCIFTLMLGLGGYWVFRSVNNQKDTFRASQGRSLVWGRKPQYVEAEYITADGEKRKSLLLTSGWWGLSRHANYIGDMMMSLSFCLTCGFSHILPYFYIFYMIALLVHRSGRDDKRCRGKYGKFWNEYCHKVPYKIIPGIY